jgi:excisionase family DNA binding protein
MAAVGNLNDYVKFQMAQGLAQGGSGTAGVGAEMAVGFAIAKEMMSQAGGVLAQTTPAAGAAASVGLGPAAGIPETLSPAAAAQALGVSEADVIASLEAGDLKGKRIGSQWRITRTALAEFLR